MKQNNYGYAMDKGCIPLCDAINNIPGLETTGSCSGHGKSSFVIYIDGKSIRSRNVLILMRALDSRYGAPPTWKMILIMNDMPEDPLCGIISSGSVLGEKAYEQSLQIVENIKTHLNHENFQKIFKVGKYLDLQKSLLPE